MKVLAAVLAGAISVAGCATANAAPAAAEEKVAAPKQVFVIRHLQKQEGDDPSLTDEGAAGARRLADMLVDKEIVAIFATPTRRAMETAAPLASRLGLAVTPYDPMNPQALAAAVAAVAGPVLVVGHSNTVHDLVGLFGGTPPAPLTEEDYGTLFVVGAEGEVATAEVR